MFGVQFHESPLKPETSDRHEADLFLAPPPLSERKESRPRENPPSLCFIKKRESRWPISTSREITVGRSAPCNFTIRGPTWHSVSRNRFPRSARARKGLSDYRGNERGGRRPLLRSSLDTRQNDGSVSWRMFLKNGSLFARWTTGNRRNHAVFARTSTSFILREVNRQL